MHRKAAQNKKKRTLKRNPIAGEVMWKAKPAWSVNRALSVRVACVGVHFQKHAKRMKSRAHLLNLPV